MSKSLFDSSVDPSVRILVQVGRWDPRMVPVMRPSLMLNPGHDSWVGTRRYRFCGSSADLVCELPGTSMADPLTLKDFILAGFHDCPADRFILILSGHAYPYVGFLTDYSTSFPHMIGISALGQVIRQACNDAQTNVDMVIMDVCYCNYLEVIYEIAAAGCQKEHSYGIHSILTHVHEGPLAGIPLSIVTQAVSDSYGDQPSYENIGTSLIRSYSGDLVLISTSQARLSEARSHLTDLVSDVPPEQACLFFSAYHALEVREHDRMLHAA